MLYYEKRNGLSYIWVNTRKTIFFWERLLMANEKNFVDVYDESAFNIKLMLSGKKKAVPSILKYSLYKLKLKITTKKVAVN